MEALPTVSELDAMSENELLFHIGRETIGGAAVPQSIGTLVKRGQEVLGQLEPQLKALLCDPDGPKAFLSGLSSEALHTAVVAVIAGTAGLGLTQIAICYVAAVLVRRGLELYCGVPGKAAVAPTAD